MPDAPPPSSETKPIRGLRIALPAGDTALEQDREWCLVDPGDGWREVRFHDYTEIYDVPGLYERLFHDILACRSPEVIATELEAVLIERGSPAAHLSALDLGAGNGLVGEALRSIGIGEIVGVDILPAARAAALRDRAGVYATYVAGDLLQPTLDMQRAVLGRDFDVLTCVAALGFGDIPTAVFERAFSRLRLGGLLAFNIKEDFLQLLEPTGFSNLIADFVRRGTLTVHRRRRYQHRLSTTGEPLHYVAVVGEKTRDA